MSKSEADADLNPAIRKGLWRREPAIDFQSAAGFMMRNTARWLP
jgi:hypothetical protein